MAKLKINKDIEVTNALPFKPFKEHGGMSLGYLNKVSVVDVESKEDANWEFAGKTFPRLEFEFKQFNENNEKDRFYTDRITPITVVLADGTDKEESNIEKSYIEMWKRVKHIADQFDGLTLDVSLEFDTGLGVDARLKELRTFYENVAKQFNAAKQKAYLTTGKLDKLLVLKLVVDGNTLALPRYVGRGIVDKAAFSKNGKLETILFFTPSETYEFPESGSAAYAGVRQDTTKAVTDAVPEDVMNIIKNAQK